MDILRADHWIGRQILWCYRPEHRTVGNGVYDGVHTTVHPCFVGDRYLWIQAHCEHRGSVDGNIWRGARPGWSRLFTGADQYDRDCDCAAIFTQCLDQGAGTVVQHRGTRDGSWPGHSFQPGGNCPWYDPSTDPDRKHVHPSITAILRWSRCIFGGSLPDLCTGKTSHTALPGWTWKSAL